MKTVAIIGAMYGDEGKGLTTDYFCNEFLKSSNVDKGAVVRFQGGAQAGHTVITPNNRRHVFSHFGSGTLLGVKTILSSKFVCNPVLFLKEYNELKLLMRDIPPVMIEQDSYISTPYDMIINQEIERSRGNKRHGSVGVGFGETVEREEVGKVSFTYKDLFKTKNKIRKILEDIREYFIERMSKLNLDYSKYEDETVIDGILEEIRDFFYLTELYKHREHEFIVFEGSQGLMLDMEYGDFPYVTRSRTGLFNAIKFCKEHTINLDEVVYITRSYSTRHGAGPFKNELHPENYYHVFDKTNKHTEFQESLRFAPLNIDKILELIFIDSIKYNIKVSKMITCMDQLTPKIRVFLNNRVTEFDKDLFIDCMILIAKFLSYGPTRNNITKVQL